MSRRAFVFGLVVAILLVIGLYRAKDGARESSAEIVRLEAQIAEAYRQKALLEAELAHLSREEWIEEYARKELGMAPAKASQVANDFNLDLLVGLPVAAADHDDLDASSAIEVDPSDLNEQAEAASNVPVTDASNPNSEEGANQR